MSSLTPMKRLRTGKGRGSIFTATFPLSPLASLHYAEKSPPLKPLQNLIFLPVGLCRHYTDEQAIGKHTVAKASIAGKSLLIPREKLLNS